MSVFAPNPSDPNDVRLAAVEAAMAALSQQLGDEATARTAAIATLSGQRSAGDAAAIDLVAEETDGRSAAVQHALDLIGNLTEYLQNGGGGGGGGPIAANLLAIAALSTAANKLSYWTGDGTASLTDLTTYARGLLGAADAGAARTSLGLGSIATRSAAEFAAIANITAVGLALLAAADAPAARISLGLGSIATRPASDFALKAGDDFAGRVTAPKAILGDTGGTESDGAALTLLQSNFQRFGNTTVDGGESFSELYEAYGNSAKPWIIQFAKTRGANPNSYTALLPGDTIWRQAFQGASGGQTAHVGNMEIIVDGSTYTPGEMNGRFNFRTGTGIQVASTLPGLPNRYAQMLALALNSKQQAFFPGGSGNATYGGAATDFGGIVTIGPGGAFTGQGAIHFQTTNAALLAVPENAVLEVDAAGDIWWTNGSGQRKKFAFQ